MLCLLFWKWFDGVIGIFIGIYEVIIVVIILVCFCWLLYVRVFWCFSSEVVDIYIILCMVSYLYCVFIKDFSVNVVNNFVLWLVYVDWRMNIWIMLENIGLLKVFYFFLMSLMVELFYDNVFFFCKVRVFWFCIISCLCFLYWFNDCFY